MIYESVAEMYSSVTLSFTSAPGGRTFSRVKVPKPPGSGKNFAKGKGVRREAESEESRILGVERSPNGQNSGLTNRNRI